MISERTLKQWRREALVAVHERTIKSTVPLPEDTINHSIELYNRILRLTQDLLDFRLLRKG